MMQTIFKRPESLTTKPFTYCPGCDHGIVHRLIAEVIDELGIRGRTVAVWPIGCSVFGDHFFKVDSILASHGKAPAVATGVARALRLTRKDAVVFTYQGDGDMASIGMGEIVHAANRGELITSIFINNAVYGMTTGQMAPTTLLGQITTTTPTGRDAKTHGSPIHMCELLSTLKAPVYIARVALIDPEHVMLNKKLNAKEVIKKAFQFQMQGRGFTFVEILCACPNNWKKTPMEAEKWVQEAMIPCYLLGEFRVPQNAAEEGGQHA
jgi:2-oxoglutarate/2-oxoacid ferredoxin oxidoreductase subunit beta